MSSVFGSGIYAEGGGVQDTIFGYAAGIAGVDKGDTNALLKFAANTFAAFLVVFALLFIFWFLGYIVRKEGLDIKLARMVQTPDAANMGAGSNAPASMGAIPSGSNILGSVDCSQPAVGDDAWMWQRANIGRAGEALTQQELQNIASSGNPFQE